MLREISDYFKSSNFKHLISVIALSNVLSGCASFGNEDNNINKETKVEKKTPENYTNYQNLQKLEDSNIQKELSYNPLIFSFLQHKEGIISAKAYMLDKKGVEYSINKLQKSEQNIIDTFYLDPSNNNSSTSYKIGSRFIEDLQNILDDILVLLPTNSQKNLFKNLIENPDKSFKFEVETKIINGETHITYIYITQDNDDKQKQQENDKSSPSKNNYIS